MKNIFLNPIIDVCIKIVKYSMQYAVPIFLLYVIIFNAIEYPIFGIILIIAVILFFIWCFIEDKNLQAEREIETKLQLEELEKERKKDRKKQKEKNIRKATMKQLIRKLPKDFEAIIEKNFKVVAGAYRKSVTSNAFGKKNYDKFLPQLQEYLEDNSKIVDRLDREFGVEVTFDEGALDKYIAIIETKPSEQKSY